MPSRERRTDDGLVRETDHRHGVVSRVLTEPSQEYLDRRSAERSAKRQRRRNEAQTRMDKFAELEADLQERLNGLPRAQATALEPVYEDLIERKRRELRIEEAESILNEDT